MTILNCNNLKSDSVAIIWIYYEITELYEKYYVIHELEQ